MQPRVRRNTPLEHRLKNGAVLNVDSDRKEAKKLPWLKSLWKSGLHNITSPNSQNWLWFLPVLFVFNRIYLLLIKLKIKVPGISFKMAVLGIFLIGFVYSFGTGIVLGFRSWTLTPLIDFENGRLLVYFLAFLLGSLCFR
jgi:hypothetical protein